MAKRLGRITQEERLECLQVLQWMLSVGYKKSQLDALEKLWWKYRRERHEQAEWNSRQLEARG